MNSKLVREYSYCYPSWDGNSLTIWISPDVDNPMEELLDLFSDSVYTLFSSSFFGENFIIDTEKLKVYRLAYLTTYGPEYWNFKGKFEARDLVHNGGLNWISPECVKFNVIVEHFSREDLTTRDICHLVIKQAVNDVNIDWRKVVEANYKVLDFDEERKVIVFKDRIVHISNLEIDTEPVINKYHEILGKDVEEQLLQDNGSKDVLDDIVSTVYQFINEHIGVFYNYLVVNPKC